MASDRSSASSSTNNEKVFIGVCHHSNQYQHEDSVMELRSELFRTSGRLQNDVTDLRFTVQSLREGMQRVKEQLLPISRSLPKDMLSSTQGGLDELRLICDRHEKAMLQEQVQMNELKERIVKIERERRGIAQMTLPEPDDEKVSSASFVEFKGLIAAHDQRIDAMECALISLKNEVDKMHAADSQCAAACSLDDSVGNDAGLTMTEDSQKEQERNNGLNVQGCLSGVYQPACVHRLEESVYEAMLLVGHKFVGRVGSFFIILSFFVNVFLQGTFCITVQTFLIGVLPERGDIQGWRDTDAHSYDYVGDSGASLVSRVCNGDHSLSIAGSQQELLERIEAYRFNDYTVIEAGILLCGVGIFVWLLFVLQELMKTSSCVKALWMQPRGQTDFIRLGEGTVTIVSVSFCSLCAMSVVMSLRFGLALVSLCQGAVWLANTPDIQDLVLNAAALTFVLDLQQIMFCTFVPLPVKALIRDMAPLQSRWGPHWQGVGMPPIVNLIISVVFVTLVMIYEAIPLLEQMERIEFDLCHGNLDFLYSSGHGNHFGVIHTTYSQPYEAGRRSLTALGVHEMIKTGSFFGIAMHWNDLSFFSKAASWGSTTFGVEISSLLGGCQDYDFGGVFSAAYVNYTIRALTGNATASHCNDVLGFCSHDNGFVRLVCPETCGCSLPRSGLFHDTAEHGCPVEVCMSSESYLKRLGAIPCEDASPLELIGDAAWQRWWQEYGDTMSLFAPGRTALWTTMSLDYAQNGCAAHARYAEAWKNSVCFGNSISRGIQSFCPVTCGCASLGHRRSLDSGCPTACMEVTGER